MEWFLGVRRKDRRKGKMLFTVRDILLNWWNVEVATLSVLLPGLACTADHPVENHSVLALSKKL
jgi:hypothetical protein